MELVDGLGLHRRGAVIVADAIPLLMRRYLRQPVPRRPVPEAELIVVLVPGHSFSLPWKKQTQISQLRRRFIFEKKIFFSCHVTAGLGKLAALYNHIRVVLLLLCSVFLCVKDNFETDKPGMRMTTITFRGTLITSQCKPNRENKW